MHIGFVDRQRRTLDLVGKAREVIIVIRNIAGMGTSFPGQLTAIDGLDFTQHMRILGN